MPLTTSTFPNPVAIGEIRYEFVRALGRGGNGTVYLAERVQGAHRQRVAVKVLEVSGAQRAIALSRFVDEYDLLTLRVHEAFPMAFERFLVGGEEAFSMEYVEGLCLGAESLVGRCLPPRVVASVGAAVARALADAWEYAPPGRPPLRLQHRDLKPDNLFVTHTGAVKILDLGAARSEGALRASDTRLQGARPVTPFYAPPEVLAGREGEAGDVWSLGVTLGALASGVVASWDIPGPELADSVSDLALRACVRSCLTRSPGERPSMASLADALGRLAADLPGDSLKAWLAAGAPSTAPGDAAGLRERPRDTFVPEVTVDAVVGSGASGVRPSSSPESSDRSTHSRSVLIGVRRFAVAFVALAAASGAGLLLLALGVDPAAGGSGFLGRLAGVVSGAGPADDPGAGAEPANDPRAGLAADAPGGPVAAGAGGAAVVATPAATPPVGAAASAAEDGAPVVSAATGLAVGEVGGLAVAAGIGAARLTVGASAGKAGGDAPGGATSGPPAGAVGVGVAPNVGPAARALSPSAGVGGAVGDGQGTLAVDIRGTRGCTVSIGTQRLSADGSVTVDAGRYRPICEMSSATDAGDGTVTRETMLDLVAGQRKTVVCDTDRTTCGVEVR